MAPNLATLSPPMDPLSPVDDGIKFSSDSEDSCRNVFPNTVRLRKIYVLLRSLASKLFQKYLTHCVYMKQNDMKFISMHWIVVLTALLG